MCGVKMTIKLLLLKSGEDIIADVQEMVSGDENKKVVFGYFLTKPCVVKMYKPNVLTEESDITQKASFQVSLYPWLPLSKDQKIPLVADWVVTMVNPTDKLEKMYMEDVINYDSKNTSLTE
jgi:hypothetical protein